MLQRDARWEVFYNEITLEQFSNDELPKIKFTELVNSNVKEAFEVIRKLLVHSYYEYLFIDVAVTKALQTFEMALVLRFKELNNNEWNPKSPLSQLIEWFRSRDFFERNDPEFFNHVRNTRNYLSHPKSHHFAGNTGFHWINTTVDLINDLYDDVIERKERRAIANKIANDLAIFLSDGAKLTYKNEEFIIYANGPLIVNNKVDPPQVFLSLLKVFDVKNKEVKWPFILSTRCNELHLEGMKLGFADEKSNQIIISKNLDTTQIQLVKEFKQLIISDVSLRMQHNSLLFDSSSCFLKIWREVRFQ